MQNIRAPGLTMKISSYISTTFSFSGFLEAEDFRSKPPRFSTCAMVRESVKRKPQSVLGILSKILETLLKYLSMGNFLGRRNDKKAHYRSCASAQTPSPDQVISRFKSLLGLQHTHFTSLKHASGQGLNQI